MKNTVELIGYYGSDETVALSAWTSTSRDLTPKKRKRIPQLIVDLWAAGHETPYEKVSVHFLVNCDIASHIHLLKHRMSSLNAESARYKELKEDKFYIPEDWVDATNPDEKYAYNLNVEGEPVYDVDYWVDKLEQMSKMSNAYYHKCVRDLTPILGRKRAKESARFFKMYNSQIQSDVQFNLRSFANFLRLRDSQHAQKEIRDIAFEMYRLVSDIEELKFSLWAIRRATELWEDHRAEVVETLKMELNEMLNVE